jgi:hypothetical protein
MNAKLQIDYTGFARLSAICSQDSGLKRVLSELEQQRVHDEDVKCYRQQKRWRMR